MTTIKASEAQGNFMSQMRRKYGDEILNVADKIESLLDQGAGSVEIAPIVRAEYPQISLEDLLILGGIMESDMEIENETTI